MTESSFIRGALAVSVVVLVTALVALFAVDWAAPRVEGWEGIGPLTIIAAEDGSSATGGAPVYSPEGTLAALVETDSEADASSTTADAATADEGSPFLAFLDPGETPGGSPFQEPSTALTTPVAPSPPASGGTPASSGRTAWVWGRVTHEVWGDPIPGIIVASGASKAITDSTGYYILPVAGGSGIVTVHLELDGTDWMTHETPSRVSTASGAVRADLAVYHRSEASGDTRHSVSYWREWDRRLSRSEMGFLVSQIRRASRAFGDLAVEDVSAVLHPGGAGRDRAVLLALWLDLASADLGFDTRLKVKGVEASALAHVQRLEGSLTD